jgi:hypothetical protein
MTASMSKPCSTTRLGTWNNLRAAIWMALIASMLATLPSLAQEQARVYKAGRLYISVSANGETLSVTAREIPRREVFKVLQSVFGIEVRPIEAPDEAISAEFSDQSLEHGIGQLVTKGSRFVIRTERERAVPAEKAVKEGSRVESGDRPAKPKEGALGPPPKGKQKPAPKLVKPTTDLAIKGGKPVTKASIKVAQAKGPKVAQAGVTVPRNAVRVNFILKKSGEVILTRATLVEGAVPQSSAVLGSFVLVVKDAAGQVRYVETQQNPLAQHSYQPNTIHDVTVANEGLFGMWIPRELLEREGTGLRLQFFDAGKVALPAQLDPKTALGALEQSKPLAEIKGEEVLRALKEGAR